MILNPFGLIAFTQWVRLEKRFREFNFSPFVIMPNHIHGIIHIVRGVGEEHEHQLGENLLLVDG